MKAGANKLDPVVPGRTATDQTNPNDAFVGNLAPALRRPRRLKFTFGEPDCASPHGGQMLIEAVCRRFGVWKNIQNALPAEGKGTVPAESLIAQLLFSFTMGGTTLKHAENLRRDPLLLEFLCLKSAADEPTLESWLNSQTDESVRLIRRTNRELVRQMIQEYNDSPMPPLTELEVAFHGKQLSPAGGDGTVPPAPYFWQTLSVGPFLLDGLWSNGSKNVKESASQLPALLSEHYETWKNARTWFCADDRLGAIIGHIKAISAAGFTFWSVAPPSDFPATGDDPAKWQLLPPAAGAESEPYEICRTLMPEYPGVATGLRHQSGDRKSRAARYLAVPGGEYENVREIFIRHDLAMNRTPVSECVVRDFDLERLPFVRPGANAAFFAIACLAYNSIAYLNSSVIPATLRHWTTRETIASLLTTPVVIAQRPERRRAYVYFPGDLLAPCRKFIETSIARTKAGRRPWWAMPDRSPAPGSTAFETSNLDPRTPDSE
jgi:hypothetical protein